MRSGDAAAPPPQRRHHPSAPAERRLFAERAHACARRIQLRARGLNPAGARESLVERLKEDMLKTGNL